MKVEYSIQADLDEADLEETLIKISWEGGGLFIKNLKIVGGWEVLDRHLHEPQYSWSVIEDVIGVIPTIYNEKSKIKLRYWRGRSDGIRDLRLYKFESGIGIIKNDNIGRIDTMIFENDRGKSIIKHKNGFFHKIQYKDIIVEKRSNGDLIWKSGDVIGRHSRGRNSTIDLSTGELIVGDEFRTTINIGDLEDYNGTWRLRNGSRKIQNILENFGDHVILPIADEDVQFEEMNFDVEYNLKGVFSADNSYIIVYGKDFTFQIDPDSDIFKVTRITISKFDQVPLNPKYMVELCEDSSVSWHGKLKADFLRYPEYMNDRLVGFHSEWRFHHGKVFLITEMPSGQKTWRFESSGNILIVVTSPVNIVLIESWEYRNGDTRVVEKNYLKDNEVVVMQGSSINGENIFDIIVNSTYQFTFKNTDRNEFGVRTTSYMVSDPTNLFSEVGTENAREEVLNNFVYAFGFNAKGRPRHFLKVWDLLCKLRMEKPILDSSIMY